PPPKDILEGGPTRYIRTPRPRRIRGERIIIDLDANRSTLPNNPRSFLFLRSLGEEGPKTCRMRMT
ncbi:hypothetical protein COCCADRAFT_86210, partial [Bipolaris zeicola 26-R-13]